MSLIDAIGGVFARLRGTSPAPAAPAAAGPPAASPPAAAGAARPVVTVPDRFGACLPLILQAEGGFVVDQGGPTNLGVTQRTLSTWLRRPASLDEVKALTPASVAPLYRALYWQVAHCDQCPAGVDLLAFDESVNEGPGHAIRHLQTALGVAADGIFGPGTAAALARAVPRTLIAAMHQANSDYYDALADEFPQDEKGWHARNDRMQAAALAMAA